VTPEDVINSGIGEAAAEKVLGLNALKVLGLTPNP